MRLQLVLQGTCTGTPDGFLIHCLKINMGSTQNTQKHDTACLFNPSFSSPPGRAFSPSDSRLTWERRKTSREELIGCLFFLTRPGPAALLSQRNQTSLSYFISTQILCYSMHAVQSGDAKLRIRR